MKFTWIPKNERVIPPRSKWGCAPWVVVARFDPEPPKTVDKSVSQ